MHNYTPQFGRGIFKDIRKKIYLLAEESTGIRMEGGKREYGLVKDNITRNVHSSGRGIKAFKTFV
jgi:hypothetical protein